MLLAYSDDGLLPAKRAARAATRAAASQAAQDGGTAGGQNSAPAPDPATGPASSSGQSAAPKPVSAFKGCRCLPTQPSLPKPSLAPPRKSSSSDGARAKPACETLSAYHDGVQSGHGSGTGPRYQNLGANFEDEGASRAPHQLAMPHHHPLDHRHLLHRNCARSRSGAQAGSRGPHRKAAQTRTETPVTVQAPPTSRRKAKRPRTQPPRPYRMRHCLQRSGCRWPIWNGDTEVLTMLNLFQLAGAWTFP